MSLKNYIKKIVAANIAISILYSNFYLCGLGIADVIAQDIKEPDVGVNLENVQFVQFENEEVSKVAVKTKVQIGLEEQQDKLPVKGVEVSINMPLLNGLVPERANVVKSNTLLTSGDENKNINQNYDSNSGLLSVSYQNEMPYANYNDESKDEFEIIYIYSTKIDTENVEEIELKYSVNAKVIFETENGQTVSEKRSNIELKETEDKGDLLEFNFTKVEEQLYKGFMYSNVENKTNYETEYNTISSLCVLNKDIPQNLTMEIKESKFVLNDNENTQVTALGNVVVKESKISKSEFDKIIGQTGSFEIYSEDTLIATVKYVDVNENEEIVKKLAVIYSQDDIRILSSEEENIVINYNTDVKSLKFIATNPIAEGYLNIKNKNIIKAAQDYIVDVKDIKGIITEHVVNDVVRNSEILLLEPETKISINSSDINFSTLQNNKITLTVNLDSTKASTKLFDNPNITIRLPEGLVSGNLSSPKIVNGNGLSIKNASANGNIITIQLEGKQTQYDLTNVGSGTSIVMDIEELDYEDTLPTHTDIIEVICKQGNEEIKANQNVNIISKNGLMMLTTAKDENNTYKTLDNDTITMNLESGAQSKDIEQEVIFVNNYEEDLKDVKIIGKLASEDSTFTVKLQKAIELNNQNVKVYYSENLNAVANDDSWTEEFIQTAKTYKIVLNNNEFKSKEHLNVKLSLSVPENLRYNEVNSIKTEIYYKYKGADLVQLNEIKCCTPIVEKINNNLMLKETANQLNEDIDIRYSVTIGGETIEDDTDVYEGQTIRYTVELNNKGTQRVDDIKIYTKIEDAVYYELGVVGDASGEDATGYIEADKTDLEREKVISLNPSSTELFEYQIVVNENVENLKNYIKIDRADKNLFEKQFTNRVKQADLKINIESEYNEEHLVFSNTELGFKINVTNLSDNIIKDVQVSCELPECLIYDIENLDDYFWYGEVRGFDKIEKENNTLYWTIKTIDPNTTNTIYVRPEVASLEKDILKKDITLIAKIQLNKTEYLSNDLIKTIYQRDSGLSAKVELSKDMSNILKHNEEIRVNISLKNSGSLNLNNIEINIANSRGFKLVKYYDVEKNEYVDIEDNRYVAIPSISISNNGERNFIIYAIIDINLVKENQVESGIQIIDDLGKNIKCDDIVYGVELPALEDEETGGEQEEEFEEDDIIDDDVPIINIPEESDDEFEDSNDSGDDTQDSEQTGKPEKPVTPEYPETQEKLYTISGQAWLDLNKDGKKDSNERTLENIVVSLVDSNNGKYVTDKNGNKITTKTNAQGRYVFENILEGKYEVIFEIDLNNYTITTYQKENVNVNENSDAILMEVTIEGQSKKVGITDKIELNSNKENIDIGLVENPIFDLSLDKQITQITVVDKQGTKTYDFEEGHTAKVDLVAKYMNGANVIVKYKFTITNKGDVTGYVDSLLDSLPSGLEFSSELNKDWYKAADGNLYTTALANKSIKPGESKEVELVLTKTMTEENAGIFVNNANLDKVSNFESINEKEKAMEDNESSAMLIISIKTGSVILYMGITLACITIIAIGAYIINKKVLRADKI